METASAHYGNGYESFGDSYRVPAAEPRPVSAPDPQGGQFIPTVHQKSGGPMRHIRGGSRFNPVGGYKPSMGGDASSGTSAAHAEKNEAGFIIFIYNMGYDTDESQVYNLFSPFGTVAKVNVIQDYSRNQGKGFGFVTMPNATEAEAAVATLNGSAFKGLTLQVRFKTPKGVGPPPSVIQSRGGSRGARGAPRGGRGGFAERVPPRGVPRGAPRGRSLPPPRGRARGAYSHAPSAYDPSYSYDYGAYDYGIYDYGYDSYPPAPYPPATYGYDRW